MIGSSSEARLPDETMVLVVGEDMGASPVSSWTDLDFRPAAWGEAMRRFNELRPGAVLVDCPEGMHEPIELIGGLRILSELPILAMPAGADTGILALRAGADAVVPKPLSRDEVMLRIERLLNRGGGVDLVLGDSLVELDRIHRRVSCRGEEVRLSPTEFRLLSALMEHPGTVLSQRELLELAWGDLHRGEAEVKLYVSYLRRKFAALGVDPIETVRGVGYSYDPRLRAEPSPEPAAPAPSALPGGADLAEDVE